MLACHPPRGPIASPPGLVVGLLCFCLASCGPTVSTVDHLPDPDPIVSTRVYTVIELWIGGQIKTMRRAGCVVGPVVGIVCGSDSGSDDDQSVNDAD